MITFEQARQIVADLERPIWTIGTYMVAEWGYHDATHWHVLSGAHEDLAEGSVEFLVVGKPCVLVDKQTGEVTQIPFVGNEHRIMRMRAVRPPPVWLAGGAPIGGERPTRGDVLRWMHARTGMTWDEVSDWIEVAFGIPSRRET